MYKEYESRPDIFIHTDYCFGQDFPKFLNTGICHKDKHSTISVEYSAKIAHLDLPLSEELVDFPEKQPWYGDVYYLEVKVESDIVGEFTSRIIYICAENAAFCSEYLLTDKFDRLSIKCIIQIRYGTGFGGAKAYPGWILNTLKELECFYLISDGFHKEKGYEQVYEKFPKIGNLKDVQPELEELRTIRQEWWSCHGDVTFYEVKS